MSIIFITKCLFLYFSLIYRKNLVDSTDSSPTHNPGTGTQGGTAVTTTAGATETVTKTGVDLSLKAKEGTNQFNYEKSGQIVTYTAKDNYAFKSVKTGKKGETVVWTTTNASEYATKVVLDGKGKKKKKVTIYFPNNTTKVYKRDEKDKPWIEIDSTMAIPKSVDIDNPQKSYLYKSQLDNITTFEAKPEFTFKSAYEYFSGYKIDFWKAQDKSKYSNKIEVENVNNSGGKAVTVYLNDNTIKLFTKIDSYKPLKEIDLSKIHPKFVNISYNKETYFYKNELKGNVRTLTAKKGFAFNQIYWKSGNDWIEIWKTENENEYAYKVFNEGDNKITIHMGVGTSVSTKVFNKSSDNKWTENNQSSTTSCYGTASKPATQ